MKRVLVVEDENSIREMEVLNLRMAGWEVLEAPSAERALELLHQNPPCDAALLDIMLPGMDGLSLCETIRRDDPDIGIIIVSAKGQEADKIRGLSIGADDYITKPFSAIELVARVKSHLRRYLELGGAGAGGSVRRVGRLEYDFDAHSLLADGAPVKLTPTETRIMELFMKNPGRIFSAEEIYARVWNEAAAYAPENTVMVHIRRIREKIELNPKEPEYLKVVWGLGYRLEKK